MAIRNVKERRIVMADTTRDLDGCYFRVQRDGKWDSICFSDLTEDERKQVLENKGIEFIRALAFHLAERLRRIGDELDIYMD